MVTETQKLIYNLYLKASRTNAGKPYRFKRNFDKFETEEYYPYVVKLEGFFKNHPHLLKDDFFNAPYKIYSDTDQFYNLKYYASFKGLSACLAYYKLLATSKPDKQTDFIKESLKFITEFCLEKKILLSQYIHYKTIAQNDFLKHLKEHRISWYVICGIPGMYNIILNMPLDEFELYFGSSIDIHELLRNYNSSPDTKELFKSALKKIEDFLQKKLKHTP